MRGTVTSSESVHTSRSGIFVCLSMCPNPTQWSLPSPPVHNEDII